MEWAELTEWREDLDRRVLELGQEGKYWQNTAVRAISEVMRKLEGMETVMTEMRKEMTEMKKEMEGYFKDDSGTEGDREGDVDGDGDAEMEM